MRRFARQSYDARFLFFEIEDQVKEALPTKIIQSSDVSEYLEISKNPEKDSKNGILLVEKRGISHVLVYEKTFSVTNQGTDRFDDPLSLHEREFPGLFSVVRYIQTPIFEEVPPQ